EPLRTGSAAFDACLHARVAPPAASRAGSRTRLVELTHLALELPLLAVDQQEAPRPVDRLLLRPRFQDRIATDHFPGLGEWPIHRAQSSAREPYAHGFRRRPETRGVEQYPGTRHLLDQLAHVGPELLIGHHAGVLVDPNHRKESHRGISWF